MSDENQRLNDRESLIGTAMVGRQVGRVFAVPRLSSLLSLFGIGLVIWAFFSGITTQFYASILFGFYAVTQSMWVSVVLLGVAQTALLIPFRVINLLRSAHLKEFSQTLQDIREEDEQQYVLKSKVKEGDKVALYYLINFVIQLASYLSIGRLFLTDFYTKQLNPTWLYGFVPYPDYPLRDRFFQIPYVWFEQTIQLDWRWVLLGWMLVWILHSGLMLIRKLKQAQLSDAAGEKRVKKTIMAGKVILSMALVVILVRFWPTGWELRVFSGDVALPNQTFNTVTAIATCLTLIWLNVPKIEKKVAMAREKGLSSRVIARTEKRLFKETLQTASLVGLGAYFVTNHIPSAFELSVFTLEMISLLSPLTLDRVILKGISVSQKAQEETEIQVEPVDLHQPEKVVVSAIQEMDHVQLRSGEKRKIVNE